VTLVGFWCCCRRIRMCNHDVTGLTPDVWVVLRTCTSSSTDTLAQVLVARRSAHYQTQLAV